MASTSETGHGKNVTNFKTLIIYCKDFGADYNPSETSITIPQLDLQLPLALNSLKLVTSLNEIDLKAREARYLIFNPLDALVTRIINALGASKVEDNTLKTATSHASKIKGERIGKKLPPKTDPNDPKDEPKDSSRSVSQQSFDSIVNNFDALIQTLKNEPNYKPNETDLKVVTLEALYNDMELKNTAVINTEKDLSNARLDRNNILYNEKTGLVATALQIKKYVKSVYSPTHSKYKQISGLAFKRYKVQ